jgi:hypothetical protein
MSVIFNLKRFDGDQSMSGRYLEKNEDCRHDDTAHLGLVRDLVASADYRTMPYHLVPNITILYRYLSHDVIIRRSALMPGTASMFFEINSLVEQHHSAFP